MGWGLKRVCMCLKGVLEQAENGKTARCCRAVYKDPHCPPSPRPPYGRTPGSTHRYTLYGTPRFRIAIVDGAPLAGNRRRSGGNRWRFGVTHGSWRPADAGCW